MKKFFRDVILYRFAKHYIAGVTVGEAINAAEKIRRKKMYPIINILGEDVRSRSEAIEFRDQYIELMKRLSTIGMGDAHISVKPSQLGLLVSRNLYQDLLGEILAAAECCLPQGLVEIDREDKESGTLIRDVSLVLASRFKNQRIVCQLRFNKTLEEIQQFVKAGISVRLCKGAEAYGGDIEDIEEIRARFFEQAVLLSVKKCSIVCATHDLELIDRLQAIKRLSFQMLLGIENQKAEELARTGHEVGIYIPCGLNWYPYSKRRWKSVFKIYWRNYWYKITRGGGGK